MAVTAAGTNNLQPKWVGSLDGSPPRIERKLTVTVANVVPGDFVTLSSGVWDVWADSGTIGGIYLGRDAGSFSGATATGITYGTDGIDVSGTGIFKGDGATTAVTTPGAVLVISPNDLIEVDINANLTMTTVVPGATVGGIGGATYVKGTGTAGWVFDLNANTVVDNLVKVYEVLVNPTASLRGRMIVRFHDPTLLSPGG